MCTAAVFTTFSHILIMHLTFPLLRKQALLFIAILLLPNYSIFSLCDMLHLSLYRFVFQCYLLQIANTGNIVELAVKPTTAYLIEDYSLPIFIKDHNIAIVTKGT